MWLTDDRDLLIILTTNGEREMPPAVLRRCVLLTLDPPTRRGWSRSRICARERASALHEAVAGAVMTCARWRAKPTCASPAPASTWMHWRSVTSWASTRLCHWKNAEAWQEVRRTVLWKNSTEPKLDDREDESE